MDSVTYRSIVLHAEFSDGASSEFGQHALQFGEVMDLSAAINGPHGGQVMECTSQKTIAVYPRHTGALATARQMLELVQRARKTEMSRYALTVRVLLGYGDITIENGRLHSGWTFRMPRLISQIPDQGIAAMEDLVKHVGAAVLEARASNVPGLYLLGGEAAQETRLVPAFTAMQNGIFSELALRVRGAVRTFRPVDCPVFIGRDKTCAIQLTGESASRVHGRVEYENSKFLYVDQSRNGSFILTGSGEEIHLQQGESIVLAGDGVISPGASVSQQKGEVIRYSCHSTKLSLDSDDGETRTLKS